MQGSVFNLTESLVYSDSCCIMEPPIAVDVMVFENHIGFADISRSFKILIPISAIHLAARIPTKRIDISSGSLALRPSHDTSFVLLVSRELVSPNSDLRPLSLSAAAGSPDPSHSFVTLMLRDLQNITRFSDAVSLVVEKHNGHVAAPWDTLANAGSPRDVLTIRTTLSSSPTMAVRVIPPPPGVAALTITPSALHIRWEPRPSAGASQTHPYPPCGSAVLGSHAVQSPTTATAAPADVVYTRADVVFVGGVAGIGRPDPPVPAAVASPGVALQHRPQRAMADTRLYDGVIDDDDMSPYGPTGPGGAGLPRARLAASDVSARGGTLLAGQQSVRGALRDTARAAGATVDWTAPVARVAAVARKSLSSVGGDGSDGVIFGDTGEGVDEVIGVETSGPEAARAVEGFGAIGVDGGSNSGSASDGDARSECGDGNPPALPICGSGPGADVAGVARADDDNVVRLDCDRSLSAGPSAARLARTGTSAAIAAAAGPSAGATDRAASVSPPRPLPTPPPAVALYFRDGLRVDVPLHATLAAVLRDGTTVPLSATRELPTSPPPREARDGDRVAEGSSGGGWGSVVRGVEAAIGGLRDALHPISGRQQGGRRTRSAAGGPRGGGAYGTRREPSAVEALLAWWVVGLSQELLGLEAGCGDFVKMVPLRSLRCGTQQEGSDSADERRARVGEPRLGVGFGAKGCAHVPTDGAEGLGGAQSSAEDEWATDRRAQCSRSGTNIDVGDVDDDDGGGDVYSLYGEALESSDSHPRASCDAGGYAASVASAAAAQRAAAAAAGVGVPPQQRHVMGGWDVVDDGINGGPADREVPRGGDALAHEGDGTTADTNRDHWGGRDERRAAAATGPVHHNGTVTAGASPTSRQWEAGISGGTVAEGPPHGTRRGQGAEHSASRSIIHPNGLLQRRAAALGCLRLQPPEAHGSDGSDGGDHPQPSDRRFETSDRHRRHRRRYRAVVIPVAHPPLSVAEAATISGSYGRLCDADPDVGVSVARYVSAFCAAPGYTAGAVGEYADVSALGASWALQTAAAAAAAWCGPAAPSGLDVCPSADHGVCGGNDTFHLATTGHGEPPRLALPPSLSVGHGSGGSTAADTLGGADVGGPIRSPAAASRPPSAPDRGRSRTVLTHDTAATRDLATVLVSPRAARSATMRGASPSPPASPRGTHVHAGLMSPRAASRSVYSQPRAAPQQQQSRGAARRIANRVFRLAGGRSADDTPWETVVAPPLRLWAECPLPRALAEAAIHLTANAPNGRGRGGGGTGYGAAAGVPVASNHTRPGALRGESSVMSTKAPTIAVSGVDRLHHCDGDNVDIAALAQPPRHHAVCFAIPAAESDDDDDDDGDSATAVTPRGKLCDIGPHARHGMRVDIGVTGGLHGVDAVGALVGLVGGLASPTVLFSAPLRPSAFGELSELPSAPPSQAPPGDASAPRGLSTTPTAHLSFAAYALLQRALVGGCAAAKGAMLQQLYATTGPAAASEAQPRLTSYAGRVVGRSGGVRWGAVMVSPPPALLTALRSVGYRGGSLCEWVVARARYEASLQQSGLRFVSPGDFRFGIVCALMIASTRDAALFQSERAAVATAAADGARYGDTRANVSMLVAAVSHSTGLAHTVHPAPDPRAHQGSQSAPTVPPLPQDHAIGAPLRGLHQRSVPPPPPTPAVDVYDPAVTYRVDNTTLREAVRIGASQTGSVRARVNGATVVSPPTSPRHATTTADHDARRWGMPFPPVGAIHGDTSPRAAAIGAHDDVASSTPAPPQRPPPMHPSDNTESHRVTITSHRPRTFASLRNIFGVAPDAYTGSLGVGQCAAHLGLATMSTFLGMSTTARSGSLFFVAPDARYIVKTLPQSEAECLLRMLSAYHSYAASHPHSLLARFTALHTLKYRDHDGHDATLHLATMLAIFPVGGAAPDVVYDLKGSTVNRSVPLHRRTKGAALKDLDFTRPPLRLQKRMYDAFAAQVASDVAFLEAMNVIDYSLLVGILPTSRAAQPTADYPGAQPPTASRRDPVDLFYAESSAHSVLQPAASSLYTPPSGTHSPSGSPGRAPAASRYPPTPFVLKTNTTWANAFTANYGGVLGEDRREVWMLGIIDILTDYNSKKVAEYAFKEVKTKLWDGGGEVSCQPPSVYASRFVEYMTTRVTQPSS